MKKITSLMLMLLCAVTTWAGVTDLPQMSTEGNIKWYTIRNTRSGGFLYWNGDDAKIQDRNAVIVPTSAFYFTGTADACYIHNAATDKLFASNESWTTEGTACTISVTPHSSAAGLAIGFNGTFLNEQNYDNGYTTYIANDAGSIFVITPLTTYIEDAIAQIEANKEASNTIYGDLKYEEESYNNLKAAYTTLTSRPRELETAYRTCINIIGSLKRAMPEEGKYYVIEAPLFNNVQGVRKGLYVNEEGALRWNTIDLTNKAYYWTVEVTETEEGDVYALKNAATGTYINGTTMSESAVTGSLLRLGDAKFNLVFNNVYLHAESHNEGAGTNGNIVHWTNGDASAWSFTEKRNPDEIDAVNVKYTFTFNGTEKYTQETAAVVGEEYPGITVSLPYGVTATKPAGNIAAEDATNGVVEKSIELTTNTPFVAADSYQNITHWYHLAINAAPYYLSYSAGQEYIYLERTSVDEAKKNAYTWGFIGNPFDGYKIVNYVAGDGMILSSATDIAGTDEGGSVYPVMMNEASLPEGYNKLWEMGASSYLGGENKFFIGQKGNFNASRMNDRSGRLAYWTRSADAGSTFQLVERPTAADEFAALLAECEAANFVAGTNPGEHDAAAVEAFNAALEAAKAVQVAQYSDVAALKAAFAAVTVNPITEGLYMVVSAAEAFGDNTRVLSCCGYDNEYNTHRTPAWAPINENDPLQYWTLEANGNGTYNLKATYEGNYLSDPWTMDEYAREATITSLGGGQFNINIAGDGFIHAQGWNWNNHMEGGPLTYYDGNINTPSAWKLVKIDETPSFTHSLTVSSVGYATLMLAFNATIPAGAECYYATRTEGDVLKLAQVEGNILPAKTPVIVKAAAGEYAFASTDATATVEGNLFSGTLFTKSVTPEGTAYVLSAPGGKVGLYQAELTHYVDNTDTGQTMGPANSFINNANKVYFDAPAAAGIVSYSFGFDWAGTTGIEGVAAEGAQDGAIYDITGRRVKAATAPGIYIVNGRKVVK